jgi:uncharacterized RDD family membrane protein YckC
VARFVDSILFGVAYAILSAVLFGLFGPSISWDPGTGIRTTGSYFLPVLLSWVISGLLYAAYDFVMHSRNGQTLGKTIMKIRLVGLHGRPLSQEALLKRSAAYPGIFAIAGVIPAFGLFGSSLGSLLVVAISVVDGLLVITDQPLHQSLHDRFADTIVIKAQ